MHCDYLSESPLSKTYALVGGGASWVVGGKPVGAWVLSVYELDIFAGVGLGACDKIWMDSGLGILLGYRVGCGWVGDLGDDGMFSLNDVAFHLGGLDLGA